MNTTLVRTLLLVLAISSASARPAGESPHPRPSPTYNYCQADTPNPDTYQGLTGHSLVKVQTITRHGDRTSIAAFIPNDTMEWNCDGILETSTARVTDKLGATTILDNVQQIIVPKKSAFTGATWPGTCIPGQLTAKGARQHMALGKAARDIYVTKMQFLPANLDPKIVYARSSNVWRTRQSASSFMSTLYPKETRNNKPLVLNTYPTEYENLMSQSAKCPRIKALNTAMEKEEAHVSVLKKHDGLLGKFKRVLNTAGISSFGDTLFNYFDAVVPRFCHNKELPSKNGESITTQDMVAYQQAVNDEYSLLRGGLSQSLEVNKMEIGLFMGDLLDNLDSPNKFELYSGHDLSIHGVLGLFQSKDMNWPPYASNIFLEVWKKDAGSEKVVRAIYNGKVIQTDWCDFTNGCPLETYVKRMRGLVPNWSKEC
jgi:hypothetical protein